MRITILGSFPSGTDGEYPLEGTYDEFAEACRGLGRRLGQARQAVVVGTDEPVSADHHVVMGIIDVAGGLKAERPLIHVIGPGKDGYAFKNLWAQEPTLFVTHPRTLKG